MHGSRSINPLVGTALLVATLALAILLAWPVAQLMGGITEPGTTPGFVLLQWIAEPDAQRAVLSTAVVTISAVILASLVALPGALALRRHASAWGGLFAVIGIVALAMPPLITAMALDLVDGRLLDRLALTDATLPGTVGLTLVYALHYLPWLLFATWLTARRHAGPLDDTARLLKAGRLTVLRRILLPAAVSGWLFGVAMMALRIIEDTVTPQRFDPADMLAPRLLAAAQEAGALDSTVSTLGLVLMLLSTVVVISTWRGLYRSTHPHPLDAHGQRYPTAPRRIHHWLGMLLLLALATLPYTLLALHIDASWMVHLRAAGEATGHTMLLPAVLCGVALLALGFVLGGLTAYEHPVARFVQLLTWAILIVPTPVLAFLILTDAGTGGTATTQEAAVILALAWAAKMMPLAQVLVADRWRTLRAGPSDLTRVRPRRGRSAGIARLFSTLAPVLLTSWCIGVIAVLGDVSSRSMLPPGLADSLVTTTADGAVGTGLPPAAAALLLTAMVGIMGTLIVRLLNGGQRRQQRRPGRSTPNSLETQ